MLRRWLFACCLVLWPLAGWPAEPLALPALTARVTDLTGTLAAGERAELELSLAALEKDKGTQVAILLLPTTQPESIEQFAIRLAEAWKIGRQGVDDGVIVVVAKDDRSLRIEVGYGLEGAIPDAIAKRIVAEQMTPRFRDGDFAGGLRAAVAALDRVIRGEALPAPPPPPPAGGQLPGTESLLFGVVFLAGLARSLFGVIGSLVVAVLAGGLAWAIFGSIIAGVVAALVAFVASFLRLGRGGWTSGGGRGGGFGGGGFSGGGGGFGGGGASGRW